MAIYGSARTYLLIFSARDDCWKFRENRTLECVRTWLPPLTLTSSVKVASSFVLQTWILYKKNTHDRILAKRNELHKSFKITIRQHKCIIISNHVFKSNWIYKLWGILRILRELCTGRVNLNDQKTLFYGKIHTAAILVLGFWFALCYGCKKISGFCY